MLSQEFYQSNSPFFNFYQAKKITAFKLLLLIGSAIILLYLFSDRTPNVFKEVPDKKERIAGEIWVQAEVASPFPTSLRDSLVDFAMGLLGTKYVEGACSKDGFDCSGFVYYVFQHFKIQVPRSSIQFKDFGKEIPIDSVKKGDVLVFLSPSRNVIGHVGIVSTPKGKETEFIHASSGGEMKVIISSLKSEGYTKRFVKAVDVGTD